MSCIEQKLLNDFSAKSISYVLGAYINKFDSGISICRKSFSNKVLRDFGKKITSSYFFIYAVFRGKNALPNTVITWQDVVMYQTKKL